MNLMKTSPSKRRRLEPFAGLLVPLRLSLLVPLRLSLLVLPLLLLTGCLSSSATSRMGTRNLETAPDQAAQGTSESSQLTGEAASGLKVVLTLQGRPAEKNWQTLRSGDSLRSGDALRTHVKLTAAAYLYVVQFFPDGTASVLFPPPPEKQRFNPPGVSIQLPDAGKIFVLDKNVGTEHVYVIASLKPLAEVDSSLVQVLADVRYSTGEASSNDESPAPAAQQEPYQEDQAPTSAGNAESPTLTDDSSSMPNAGSAEGSAGKTQPSPASKPAETSPTKTWSAQKKPKKVAKDNAVVAVAALPRVKRSQISLDMNTRGLKLTSDPEAVTASMVYAADKDGIAILHFELKHLP